MAPFLINLCKALLACLIMGAGLSFFGITMPVLLALLHLTPDDIRAWLENAYLWSVPRIVLGAVIVLPAWLLIYIFLPPRGE